MQHLSFSDLRLHAWRRGRWLLGALLIATGLFAAESPAPSAQKKDVPAVDPFIAERNEAYAKQLETHLLKWLIDDYPARAAEVWQRDYSSTDAFVRSVEPNRDRWRQMLKPPVLKKPASSCGALIRLSPI